MNKAYIFDWSGTLSDNFHCFKQVCDLMFRELGKKPLSEEEIKQEFTLPYMKFWNSHFPDLSKEKQDELYEKYIHQVGEAELYTGVIDLINSLYAQGYMLFIVSSDPVSKLIPETKKTGLSQLFTKITGSVHDKDEVISDLVNEFGLDKETSYYVGDTSGDVEAGKSAGVKTIGISWGFQSRGELAKSNPDFLIDDLAEISDLTPDK